MTVLSRRGFLKWLGHRAQDRLPQAWIQRGAAQKEMSVPVWRDVGTYAEYSPGVRRSIQGEAGWVMVSSPEGIQAVREDGVCLAVRLTSQGRVEVHALETWPESMILSHITGEPTFLESTSNEREL